MSGSKRINFLPSRERPAPPRSSWPALGLTLLVCALCGWLAVPPLPEPVAHATPPPPTTRAPNGESVWRLGPSDPLHPFLVRAEGWYPWHAVLAAIDVAVRDRGNLQTVSYSRDAAQLEIVGTVDELPSLADLAIDLAKWSFLVDAEPHDVGRSPEAARTRFTLRLRVAPLVGREEAKR